MTLIHLGIVNAVRNLGRSLLSVVAMALAAMMMTGSLAVAEGYTARRAAEYRSFLGGDVLVYPTWVWPTRSDVESVVPGTARLVTLPRSFASPLRYFHPDFYSSGYLTVATGAPSYSMFGSRADLDEVREVLLAHPEVTGVEPYRALPVIGGSLEITGPDGSSHVSLGGHVLRSSPPNLLSDAPEDVPGYLRLVPAAADIPATVMTSTTAGTILSDVMNWTPGVFVSRGRALSSADDDRPVAVVNRRAVLSRAQVRDYDVAMGLQGQTVRLTIPRIVPGDPERGTGPYYDFSRPVTVDISVVGAYDVASRLFSWNPFPDVTYYEQLYLEAPEILLTPAAFDRILQAAGLPAGELPPVGALAVSLRDQSKAVAVTEELRGLVPSLSVVTVAQEADFANARNLPETIYECPPDFRPRPLPLSQPAVPPEARQFFGLLLFGFAGLVAAGNSTLMILSRRTEFAILKAIGMRGFEIGLVVMVEVVTLAVIGLVLGFSVAEVGSLPIILTNRIGPAAVLKAIGRDFAIVASATLACAVVFALVPMSRTLRITVAEAMRGDE